MTPYLFLLPAAVLFLLFTLIPILFGFGISLFKWDSIDPPRFIAFLNWKMLFSDSIFFYGILTTLKFTVANSMFGIVLGIGLAILVDRVRRGRIVFRSIYFTPVVTSAVAVSYIIRAIFKSETGIINYLIGFIGLEGPKWLGSGTWAFFAVMLFSVWLQVGNFMLIFLAGLQMIPETLYEAAYVDGANWVQTFRKVTLPMLSPTIFFVMVISLIGNAQLFDTVYTLTLGGPGYATVTMVYNIYRSAYFSFSMGYASSQSVVLFFIIMILTLIQWKYQEKWVHYE